MAITKTIDVGGVEVTFRTSAAVPRIYRNKFGRDVFSDLSRLESATSSASENGANLDAFSLETFEDLAWVMARHADPAVPENPDEWLERFDTFSIYEVLPELLELWNQNSKTLVETGKKNSAEPQEK